MQAKPEMRPIDTIVVVVVTNRGPDDMIRRCLASVAIAGGADAVVVVDNSARPTTSPQDYGVNVDDVVRTDNAGFGAAANVGVRRARELTTGATGLAIALLNDDVEVATDWLVPLRAGLDEDAGVGAVQPKLLLATDHNTPQATVNSVGVNLDRYGAGSDIGYGESDDSRWSDARDIEIFTGGAVLFRDEFMEDVGGFDERYFLYYEDVDLALRGAERGWRYRCDPTSVVHHAQGSTTTVLGASLTHFQERNRLWAAFRFGSGETVRRAIGLSVRRLRHHPRRVHARALLAGLAGAPRAVRERRRAKR